MRRLFNRVPHGNHLVRRLHSETLEARLLLTTEAISPQSALIYQEQFDGQILAAGAVRSQPLDLDAGQSLSVALAATGGLIADFALRAPDGATLASGEGTSLHFKTLPISQPGTYTLDVAGASNSVGDFSLDVFLNASLEDEQHGGAANDTFATAEALLASEFNVGGGASRLAVAGGATVGDVEDWYSFTLDDGEVATLAFADDALESGVRLELYDSAQGLLAVGFAHENVDQAITNFGDATTNLTPDTYYARVVGPVSPYRLSVSMETTLELGVGNSFTAAQPISTTGSVLGFIDKAIGGSVNPLSSFPGIQETTSIPPDPTIAVGPDQAIVMVNTAIAAFDKVTGTKLYEQDLRNSNGFFGSAGATNLVFDPWIIYDTDSQRFYALGVELTSSVTTHIYLAVSTDSTPTSLNDWNKYKFDVTHVADGTGLGTGAHFPDYPKFSVGQDAVYVSGNYFAITSGTGNYAGITAIEKAPLLTGDPANVLYQEHFTGFSVFPLQHEGDGSTQYFAESTAGNKVRIHAVTDVLTSPARHTFDVAVDSFGEPIGVPQPGGVVPADTVSSRVMTGVWRDGSAWFAHPITDPAIGDGETVARWYEVRTNSFPAADPTLVQSGNVDPGPGVHAFMPAITVNSAGAMAIGFSLGGSERFLGAGYTGRLATDPLGTVTTPVYQWLDGEDIYQRLDLRDRNRWGDYSGLVVDPADDSIFWIYNQFASGLNEWSTEIGSFQIDAIPESDWYEFEVGIGQTFTVSSSTPLDGPNQPTNQLDPVLEIYNPSGDLVASDDNSAPDGRNATVTHTVALGGTYRVKTYGANDTRGNYFLEVSNSAADPPISVLDTNPDPGQRIDAFPASITVTLTEPVLASSVQATDLRVNDVAATGVTIVDGVTLEFSIDPGIFSGDGSYVVAVPTGGFDDLQGSAMPAGFSGSFEVDTEGPRFVSTLWNGAAFPSDEILPAGPLVFEADLSEGVFVFASPRRGPFSPGRDDVLLVDRDTGATFQPDNVNYDPNTRHFTANFVQPLPEGNFTMTVVSGDGAFADDVGNGLDGEPLGGTADGTPTGDGTPGGDYTIDLTLDAAVMDAAEFVRVRPRGSLVYASHDNEGSLVDETDEDRIRFFVQAGQTVAAELTFANAITATAEIVGLTAPIQGGASGPLVIPPTAVGADGFVELRLTGSAGSRYSVDILLDAGFESQTGDADGTVGFAIDQTRLELSSGQWAVLGETPGGSPDVDLYTVDLATARGSFIDVVLQGQGSSYSGATLELLDPAGAVVATAVTGENLDLQILEFQIPDLSSGSRYGLRVTADSAGKYVLLVRDGQVVETDSDGNLLPRTLADGGRAIGFLVSDQSVVLEPDDFPVATVLSSAVAGVTLSRFSGGDIFSGSVDASSFLPPTGTRVFASDAFGPFGFRLGGDELFMEFDEPVATVSIMRGSNFPATAALLTFDEEGNLLESAISPPLPPNLSEEILISREQAEIHSAAAAGILPVPFDRLEFSTIAPDLSDRFLVEADAGEVITVLTRTLLDELNGSPLNGLDPELVIFQPDGTTVLAQDTDSLDGKNAQVSFSAPTTGAYVIEVRTTSGKGEYLIELDRGQPDAVDDSITVDEGALASTLDSGEASVLANDSGLVDTPFELTLDVQTQHASSFALFPDGTFAYQHNGSEEFVDSFTYTVEDYNGQSDTATVHITIIPISSETPLAADDVLNVDEGGTVTILASGADNVLANDSGLGDAPIVVSLEVAPQFTANFSLDADGTFSYEHDDSENHVDSFVYRITDNDGQTSTATVAVNITPINDSTPVATADALTVDEGQTTTVLDSGATSLLANDTGLDDSPLLIEIETPPDHASLTINGDGTFSYAHDGTENFADSFVYRVTDNDGQITTATVTVTVRRVSDATPDAIDDAALVDEAGTVTDLVSGASSVLTNDAGLDDTPIAVALETSPQFAANFLFESDGTFTYTHDGTENFSDSFSYRITDNDGETEVATVTISITPVSDSTPTVQDATISTFEGGTATTLSSGALSVLDTASGLADTPIMVSVETAPMHAANFGLFSDGTFNYTHDGTENFADSFVFRVTDNDGQTATATITIGIAPISDATPSALDDTATVDEAATITVLDSGATSVLANDLGLDDGPIEVTLVTPPAHFESFTLVSSDGTFSYTHDGSENFSDSFVYRLTDNDGQTTTGTVSFTIMPVSDAAPDAIDDSAVVDEGGNVSELLSGASSVVTNDVGLEDTPIQIELVTDPQFASSFSFSSDGTFDYSHDGSENFSDSFRYRLTDRDGEIDEATVTIAINRISDATPAVLDASITVDEGGTATRLSSGQSSVLAGATGLDDVPIMLAVETPPAFAADFQLLNDGTFIYEHDGTENFSDSFVFRITDNDGETAGGTVTITINPANDTSPLAADDAAFVDEGGLVTLLDTGESSVLANDQGLDDTPIVVSVETPPNHATDFVLFPDGTFSYRHDGTENFADVFRYSVTDSDGQVSTGTVRLTINQISDTTPNAIDDEVTVDEGATVTELTSGASSVVANDVGLSDTPVVVALEAGPQFAANFAFNSDGTFFYEHSGAEQFVDTFTYTITDNDGQTDTATVHITVTPVSDATPTALDDELTVDEAGTASLLTSGASSLLANDINLADTPVTLVVETLPQFGSITLHQDGTFEYVHSGEEEFQDSFSYRVTDSDGESDTANVTITINRVSDTEPDAIDDEVAVDRGQSVSSLIDGSTSVLANDLGLNDTPITISLVSPPTNQSAFSLNADGSFFYEHDGGPSESDQFVYSITDNDGQTDTATVTVTLPPLDQAPQANDDSLSIVEGGTGTVLTGGSASVLSNDSGLANGPVTLAVEADPQHSSVFVFNGDGTFIYTHDGSENFVDSFEYRITDADGDFDTATVTITIDRVSDALPSAFNDTIEVDEGGTATSLVGGALSVLDNDTGLADEPAEVTLLTPPQFQASFVLNPDGTFSYEHDDTENFSDSFQYQVVDNDGHTATATVSITITPVNEAIPQATGDEIRVLENGTTSELSSGETTVLANDSGLDDGPVTVTLVTGPSEASSFELNADGTFLYTHGGGPAASDSFSYRITDRDGDVSVATATIIIQPDTTPLANNDVLVLDEGGTATRLTTGEASVLANDTGLANVPINVQLVDGPDFASNFVFNGDGTFLYTHDGSENFSDSFSYRVTDSDGETEEAIVQITINRRSDATPTAVDDQLTVSEDATITLASDDPSGILANDTGLVDTPIDVELTADPLHGSLTIDPDGTLSYTHDGSENFLDQATYQITDNDGQTSTATIEFLITPVSDTTPVAINDTLEVDEGGTATVLSGGIGSVLQNDQGFADGPIVLVVEILPAFAASFTLNDDGTFSYTHDGDENFSDSFSYRITDNDGQTDVGIVDIVIRPISDATPLAVDDTIEVVEGSSPPGGPIMLLANDSGLDDGPVEATIVTPPSHGLASLASDGALTYEHNGDEVFADEIVYRITDNDGQASEATVRITVTPVSDAVPQPQADLLVVDEAAIASTLADGSLSVLDNDIGLADGPIILGVETPPSFAADFQLNPDGTFRYEHNGEEVFEDAFTYRVTDNDGETAAATVSISINAVSDAVPDAVDDEIVVAEGGTIRQLADGGLTLLDNDAGLLDLPVAVELFGTPQFGTLSLGPDGSFSYTHDGSENFTDSFQYQITDNDGQTDVGEVTITINPASDADPVANDDLLTVAEGGSRAVLDSGNTSLLDNDDGLVDQPVTVSLVGGPAFGTLDLQSDGTFLYEHDGSENFADEFTYLIEDADGQTSIGTVSIAITPVSDAAPTAVDDLVTVNEGAAVVDPPNVGANDEGLLDAPIVFELVAGPAFAASFSFDDDGAFEYTHDGSENFSDSFTYRVTDSDGESTTGTVTLAIVPVSDSEPDAVADRVVVDEGGTVTETEEGQASVLDNDAGFLDDPVAIELIQSPQFGTLDLRSDGTFSYTHDGSDELVDSFAYQITDNDGQSDSAVVTIAVNPISDADPIAVGDSLTLLEGGTSTELDSGAATVLANDQGLTDGPVIVFVVSRPTLAAQFVLQPDGTFTYEHDGSERFTDEFTYGIEDNDGQISTATVSIVVAPVSDSTPFAVDHVVSVEEGAALVDSPHLLDNVMGLEDVPIIVEVVTAPTLASQFAVSEDGAFSYTHNGDEVFSDFFSYRVTDNDGESSIGTVTIAVTPISDTNPDAVNDTIVVDEGGIATTTDTGNPSVLGNDAGLADTPVVIALLSDPEHGLLTFGADGTFSYTHDGTENFSDSFSYHISDNDGQQDVAIVRIKVNPISEATPIANDDRAVVNEGGTVASLVGGARSVLANDEGLDDAPPIVEVVERPQWASAFELLPDGTFSYTHDGTENFIDQVTYRVTDNDGDTVVGTMLLNINPVSDATPDAEADQIVVDEGADTNTLVSGEASVLANDTGLLDGPITVALLAEPESAASFELNEDGTFIYEHDGSEEFADSFAYSLTDNDGQVSSATVTISINRISDSIPDAIRDRVVVDEAGSTSTLVDGGMSVLQNDFGLLDGPIELSLEQGPTNAGSFVLFPDGTFSYRHSGDEIFEDSFSYRITDNDGESDVGIVDIAIRPVSDATPFANDDVVRVDQGGVQTVLSNGASSILSNDINLVDTPIQLETVIEPLRTVEFELNQDGTFRYVHDGSNDLVDEFFYTITDNDGQSSQARVEIRIQPTNPVVGDDRLPVASVSIEDILVASDEPHGFLVRYQDNDGVSPASLDTSDLVLRTPAGNERPIVFRAIRTSSQRDNISAAYFVPQPEGGWTANDDGTYQIVVVENQVFDLSGNALPPGVIGEFDIAIAGQPPHVVATEINDGRMVFDELSAVAFQFDQSVTVTPEALSIVDVATNLPVDTAAATLIYNAQTRTARWDTSALQLDRGRYRLGLIAGQVFGTAGQLDGNDDGIIGGDFVVGEPFPLTWAGDVDRDLDVDFGDFLVLSANFLRVVDAVWQDGSFDENGMVDFADFLQLSFNFGRSIGAGSAPLVGSSEFNAAVDEVLAQRDAILKRLDDSSA